jgi:[ribosomal protein S5]-alanine N-acetyltransferase
MDSAKLSARVCSYFGARAGYGSGMDDIVTDRLRLRPLGVEDLDAYAGIMGDPEVGKWFPKGTSYTREESEKSLSSIMEHWDKYGFGIWAVRTRGSPTLLGRCGLNTVTEIGEVEVDFAFSKAFWGRGYGTESARAALLFGFQNLSLKVIIGLAKPDNTASRRVLEKIGMHFVGNIRLWGIDCTYYAISESEYLRLASTR